MSESENTIELLKVIDQRYVDTTALFRDAAANAEPGSVVRDIYYLFKKTYRRMHRLNGTWKTMYHGTVQYDDDEMGSTIVVIGTDVSYVLTGTPAPRMLLKVENLHLDQYEGLPTLSNSTDLFLDQIEVAGPDLPDDLLLASNYMAHAEAIGYKLKVMAPGNTPDGDRIVQIVLTKPGKAIGMAYNLDTSVKDISQMILSKRQKEKTLC